MTAWQDIAHWIPFVAAGVNGGIGGDGPSEPVRKVTVRVAEIAIVLGFMWMQVSELSKRVDSLNATIHKLELQLTALSARGDERYRGGFSLQQNPNRIPPGAGR